ncbi:EAL domain-containing protein [Rhodoferax sp. TBRC 17660]|uniref:EAL domain-containing protein n=1 Tax=Rhodoferax potami TaxID=3068338 RepID=A0ABU3KJ79_9BURK|nr:EAL domain-containing protein [Rhodoferax sp. TBRC 17660]MDT7517826.1 EAL domain-containing protein [Rhodoferax sp. TBRC 17660]
MHILIAEDEPSLRENLQWMLELEGYEVTAAADGRVALAAALAHRPDLVLTDVMMPELDGFGLIKALRSHPATATLPVIMLTARADRSDTRTGMNLGADDYLTKPCRREELLAAISARLERSRIQQLAAQRLQTEAQQAMQIDTLTGLPGRDLFEEQLDHAVSTCETVALLCFGLDGFSKINESLGTGVGDLVLREVGKRLQQCIRGSVSSHPHDVVGRLGGDQFAVCVTGLPDACSLAGFATVALSALAQPYRVSGHTLFLTASAGGSTYPAQADSVHALLLNAESALHHAKPDGPGMYAYFDSAMNRRVARTLLIHNELHSALHAGDLELYYQPQIRIATGKVVGFEALLRWHHATLGAIPPSEFIPIAEQSGIIVQVGEWVLRTAAQQAARWIAQGHQGFRIAVNISARQFVGQNLPELVGRILKETGIPPSALELEVTESLALHNVANTLATLHECKALGVHLAMDDFGTGYSSLSYLKRYPLDTLKIDQSFVRNIPHDLGDVAITRAIVAMAQSFGLSLVAEGVETPEQLAYLRELGCDDAQGYLFSPAVPAPQAERFFTEQQNTALPA